MPPLSGVVIGIGISLVLWIGMIVVALGGFYWAGWL